MWCLLKLRILVQCIDYYVQQSSKDNNRWTGGRSCPCTCWYIISYWLNTRSCSSVGIFDPFLSKLSVIDCQTLRIKILIIPMAYVTHFLLDFIILIVFSSELDFRYQYTSLFKFISMIHSILWSSFFMKIVNSF